MITVKEFPYLTLIWDSVSRALILQWRGGFKGRNLKQGLDVGLEEFIQRHPEAQWIGDTTDIGVIGDEEQQWIDTNWFPRFLATGVKYMAVVQPRSALAKMSVRAVVSKIPGGQLTIFNCATLEEAREWMQQQDF
mgnify:CR=1 FL=1|jgi:hypothetical protein